MNEADVDFLFDIPEEDFFLDSNIIHENKHKTSLEENHERIETSDYQLEKKRPRLETEDSLQVNVPQKKVILKKRINAAVHHGLNIKKYEGIATQPVNRIDPTQTHVTPAIIVENHKESPSHLFTNTSSLGDQRSRIYRSSLLRHEKLKKTPLFGQTIDVDHCPKSISIKKSDVPYSIKLSDGDNHSWCQSGLGFFSISRIRTQLLSSSKRLGHQLDVQEQLKKDATKIKNHIPSLSEDYLYFTPPSRFNSNMNDYDPIYLTPYSSNDSISQSNYFKQWNSFLQTPIPELLKQLEIEHIQTQRALCENPVHPLNTPLSNTTMDLWTTKYTPSKYLDLLTDENFNRTLLKWLKQFGKERLLQQHSSSGSIIQPDNDKGLYGKQSSKFLMSKIEAAPEMSQISEAVSTKQSLLESLPVILISGPPGIGKTTAIYVIAKQAGFDLIEVNASDDRTKDKLITMIQNVSNLDTALMNKTFVLSTASQSSHHNKLTDPNHLSGTIRHGRPNLLLLDEIEGADPQAIDAIIKLIETKDKRGQPVIKRPIICCCNTIYNRHLRLLRQKVKVFIVEPLQEQKLIKRLSQICEDEHIETDIESLPLIVKASQGDIRSCLNHLQLISRGLESETGKKKLTHSMVTKAFKLFYLDRSLDELPFLQQLLYNGKNHQKLFPSLQNTEMTTTHFIDSVIDNSNDFNTILFTLQDNLSRISFSDPCFSKMAYFYDLLCETDCIRTRARLLTNQAFLLPILCSHLYCSSEEPLSLSRMIPYPLTIYFKSQSILQKRLTIQHHIMDNVIPHLRHTVGSSVFSVDLVYWLTLLSTPGLLFKSNNLAWRQYHTLTLRPVAGIPLNHQSLVYPLNTFHHFLEILVTYNLTFSKTPCVEILPPSYHRSYRDTLYSATKTSSQSSSFYINQAKNEFCLNPPLHLFFERYCHQLLSPIQKQSFYTIQKTQLPNDKRPEGNQHILSQSSSHFREVNATFDGYEYINLQLTRLHSELLRKEILQICLIGTIPIVQSLSSINRDQVIHHDIKDTSTGMSKPNSEHYQMSRNMLPCKQLLQHLIYQQQQRQIYEETIWRESTRTSQVITHRTMKDTKRTHIEYEQLFDAEVRSSRRFIYKYESGDAKAVQFIPSLKELFDMAKI